MMILLNNRPYITTLATTAEWNTVTAVVTTLMGVSKSSDQNTYLPSAIITNIKGTIMATETPKWIAFKFPFSHSLSHTHFIWLLNSEDNNKQCFE